jgi:hypothetical protein
MQGGQRLLRLRLHGHGTEVVVPERLEEKAETASRTVQKLFTTGT